MLDRSDDMGLFDEDSTAQTIADGLRLFFEDAATEPDGETVQAIDAIIAGILSSGDSRMMTSFEEAVAGVVASQREQVDVIRELNDEMRIAAVNMAANARAMGEHADAMRDYEDAYYSRDALYSRDESQRRNSAEDVNRPEVRRSNSNRRNNLTVARRESNEAQKHFTDALRDLGLGKMARTESQIYDTLSTWADRIATVRDIATYAMTGDIPSRLAEIGVVTTAPRVDKDVAEDARGRIMETANTSGTPITHGQAGAPAGEPVDALHELNDVVAGNERGWRATHTAAESMPSINDVTGSERPSSPTVERGPVSIQADSVTVNASRMDGALADASVPDMTETPSQAPYQPSAADASSPSHIPSLPGNPPERTTQQGSGDSNPNATPQPRSGSANAPSNGTSGTQQAPAQQTSSNGGQSDTGVGGIIGRIIGTGAEAFAGKGTLGTVMEGIGAIRGGAGIASTIGGTALKLAGGPVGLASAAIGGAIALNNARADAVKAGSMQGGGLMEGIGMSGQNMWQDFLNFTGFTTVDSRQLNQMRQTVSSMGVDITSDMGERMIKNQTWAADNGMDAQDAAIITRALMETGVSASETSDALKDMKDATNGLNMDFKQFSGTVANISDAARNWGGNAEGAGEASKGLYGDMGEAGMDKTEENVSALLSSPLAQLAALKSGANIWQAAGGAQGISSFLSDNPDAAGQMMDFMNGFIGNMASNLPEDQQESFSAYMRRQLMGNVTGNGEEMTQNALESANAGNGTTTGSASSKKESVDISVTLGDGLSGTVSRNGLLATELSNPLGNGFVRLNNLGAQ